MMRKYFILLIVCIFAFTSIISYSENTATTDTTDTAKETVNKDANAKDENADKEKEEAKLPISGFVELVNVNPLKKSIGESEFFFQGVGLAIDAENDLCGVSADYRLSDVYKSSLGISHYLERAEVFFKFKDIAKLKIGKLYSPFGLLGDNTWYFSLLYYQGLTYDADWGAGLDIVVPVSPALELGLYLNYQLMSDGLNGTYYAGLTADSTEGEWGDGVQLKERDSGTAKIDAKYKLNDTDYINVGVSGMYGRLKKENIGKFNYLDIAGHLDVNISMVRLLGEAVMFNNNVNKDDNIMGQRKGLTFMGGFTVTPPISKPELLISGFDFHANYSQLIRDYNFGGTKNDTKTNLIIIGIGIKHNDILKTTIEYAYGLNDMDVSDNYFANHIIAVFSASF